MFCHTVFTIGIKISSINYKRGMNVHVIFKMEGREMVYSVSTQLNKANVVETLNCV